MSFWRCKQEAEYVEMTQVLQAQPGLSAHALAQQLGVPTSTVLRRLPNLEEAASCSMRMKEDGCGRFGGER